MAVPALQACGAPPAPEASLLGGQTTPVLCQPAPGLRINEFLANPAGPDAGREWIELSNQSDRPIALAGALLSLGASYALKHRVLPKEAVVLPHATLLLGDGSRASRQRAQGAEVDIVYGAAELPNDAGHIQIACQNNVLAQVEYGPLTPMGAPASGRASAWQPDGNFCHVLGPRYDGRDQGSPNAVNPPCVQCEEAGQWRSARVLPTDALRLVDVQFDSAPAQFGARRGAFVRVQAQTPLDLHDVQLVVAPEHRPMVRFVVQGPSCLALSANAHCRLPVLPLRAATEPAWRGSAWPRGAAELTFWQRERCIGRARLSASVRGRPQTAMGSPMAP